MIRFVDVVRDFAEVAEDARSRVDGVLARGEYVLGPQTRELEAALAARLGAPAAIAVSSGSDALMLALLALGIGAGDAVVVPAFSFFATAGAVVRVGAQPVFADIDRTTFVSRAEEFRTAIDREFDRSAGRHVHRTTGARLAALLPVHLYGRACAMEPILALARETGAAVVEDAAQAIDCRLGGVAVGRFGAAGCFSFYPTKNLGGAGDGGLVTCEDAALAARITRLRSHGADGGAYEHHEVGINARMSELAAAVLNAKLARLGAWTARRRELATLYRKELADAARTGLIVLPEAAAAESHVWHQFAIRIEGGRNGFSRRERVRERLETRGIPTRVYYPLPLHRQPCFAGGGHAGVDLPEADSASREVLCLPIHPSLADEDVVQVADALAAEVRDA